MKTIRNLLAVLLFTTPLCAQSVFYGPRIGSVSEPVSNRYVMSTFETGDSEFLLTDVGIVNNFVSFGDSVFLYELSNNMEVVSSHPIFWQNFTVTRRYGVRNFFKPFAPLTLKPNTKYGVFWISGSNAQAWKTFSSPMKAYFGNINQSSNYYYDALLVEISENLAIFLYGVEK